ncbi:hypothetical protein K7432_016315 [Basidiobolus ranarum]|uniref:Uncharacterized protein n=1 Tax=Basidiobolus ranarum TaxID=34480 RepID=A0ABR2WEX0_9FUNG
MSDMDDVVRSIANTSLKLLLGSRYTELLGMSSDELFQRAQLLSEPNLSKQQEFQLFQWSHGIKYEELAKCKSELDYSVPVRYKRFDSNDLRAYVEIQKEKEEEKEGLGIMLRLEEGWVYFDVCRDLSSQDKLEWTVSIEEAEEKFHSNDKNTERNQTIEEEEADYWAQYGQLSDSEDKEQKEDGSKNEEQDYWSQYDQVDSALDQTEVGAEPFKSLSQHEDKYVELEVSDDFLKELESIEKEELLNNDNQSVSVKENEDEFIQISASTPIELKNDTDSEDGAFSPPQLVSPVLPSNQKTLAQYSSPQAPLNPPHPRNITVPDSEMASRLDLTTMLTFAMGNINNLQSQQSQWKPLISQLLKTSKDMAKLAGLSDIEISELLHDAYGDILPNL